jgi:LysM repeat protein
MIKRSAFFITLLLLKLMILAACAGEPQTVEVTRIVTQEVPATVEVEVTRVVTETAVIEATRLIEIVITATPAPTETAVTPSPTATPTSSNYVIETGDTLPLIAGKTGSTVAAIREANDLSPDDELVVGEELLIPGWDGVFEDNTAVAVSPTVPAIPTSTSPATSLPATELVVSGPNLLPNPSFEGDWYFHQFNELQIPEGWLVVTDEGPNTLTPGSGGNFLRPEIRVIPESDLPPAERSLFIFDGMKTVKAFKGGAPTSFSLFTDVALQPGSYRLTVRFFPDIVAGYERGQKVFATDPLAAEVRLIYNEGGTAWQGTQIGQRNTLTYDFTVTQARTVRVGASFRNRYIMDNNGWFIDHWSLQALTPP